MSVLSPQAFRQTRNIHRAGLAADRPAASLVLVGTLYFSTDTGILERSDGTAWSPYSSTGAIPTAHHVSHETGGSDAIASLAGSVINSGTVADARLSSNIPLLNGGNTFTSGNQFNIGIFERGRTLQLGTWLDIPFNAANFTTDGPGTWTVDAAALPVNRFTLVGRIMFWSIYISWFAGTNVVAGTVTELRVNVPGGLTVAASSNPVGLCTDGTVSVLGAGAYVYFSKGGAAFTPGAVGIVNMMTWEI